MARSDIIILSAFILAFSQADGRCLSLDLDPSSGRFHVNIQNERWFSSGAVFFRANGEHYTTTDGSLTLIEVVEDCPDLRGVDSLGAFSTTILRYSNPEGQEMVGSIKIYDCSIVFDQTFPTLLENTSSGNPDEVISGFPTFVLAEAEQDLSLGYAHWLSFYHMDDTPTGAVSGERERKKLGFYSPSYGRWDKNSVLPGGIGGSGVTGVFDPSGLHSDGSGQVTTAILSPYNSFMAASQTSPAPGLRFYGIMGNVSEVPAGYSLQTLLFVKRDGINDAVLSWGELLRSKYGTKTSSTSSADITRNYLGVSTDNGAFYYYNTMPGLNYQETMISIKEWYYQDHGVSDWSPMADIFPDGMEYIYSQTGMLVQAHNRYWSGHAVYATENGGDYLFLIDGETGFSLPLEQAFWDDFLSRKSSWGLRVYEQDWLKHQMDEKTPALMRSVNLADMWLTQMARAAEKNNIVIQYCMAYMRFLLQSVKYPAVTQTRASGDYLDDSEQWRIGGAAVLLWALGLAPSKDGFWSVSEQSGNPYGENVTEVAPRLQSAVLSLSAGPVAVGDKIGVTDVALVMRACRADGRLLHPSSPAMALDAVTIQASIGSSSDPVGPTGEVWAARSVVAKLEYVYLLVADLVTDWPVYPAHLGLSGEFWVYEANNTSHVSIFSDETPLMLKVCSLLDFSLYTFVPIHRDSTGGANWAVQGEVDKWVSVAAARFQDISTSSADATAIVSGTMGEVVRVGFIDPTGKEIIVECEFDEREEMVISSNEVCS